MTFRTLVSAEQLMAQVENSSWRVFDCRHDLANPEAGEQAYRGAHILNSRFLHLERDLSGPKTGKNGRHPLPDPVVLASTLARCGVSNESQVVAYDDGGGMFAARLWWLLRWLGHEKVALLDGGLPAWQSAGYPLTGRAPRVRAAVFRWRSGQATAEVASIQAQMRRPTMRLIDARAPDRFRGENETLDPRAGHIPGAVNRFFKDNLAADGRFKSAAQLHREFDELLGEHPVENVVAYCGSGVAACHNLLALEIAGLHGARLFPGSWSEWCGDARRPVATGAG